MTVTVGGQKTSVLSRIAAYGTDYSGRTNKAGASRRARSQRTDPGWFPRG